MMILKGKIAIITGSSRGIGRGIAIALARAGASVCLTYNKNKKLAEQIAKDIAGQGGRAMAVQLVVEDRESMIKALGTLTDSFGPINILVNNAAISQEKPFDTITDEDWDNMMAVNLRGPFACCQEVLPDMLKQGWGRIINMSSIGGQWGGYNQVHYAASKAGLINLTRSIAKIYSEYGITANAVAIGLTKTDMSGPQLESEAGKKIVEDIPIGRIATIEEIANTVKFLCSDDASYITGQTINVNGGMYFG